MYIGHCLSAAGMFLGNQSISDWIFVAAIASSIECDDHGAEYIEGRVKCILSDILKNPDTEMLKQFLPAAIESNEAAIGSQLLVQASLSAWQLGSREVASPLFMGAFFPQMDLPVTVLPVRNENISKITALKAKAARTSVRVESASALIWKCAMTASKSNLGFQEILCCLSA
uniref:Uncharacterized protein n=1 Tax=Populus trichocarpa TaxID=3694 RepID=B9HTD0_POPTR